MKVTCWVSCPWGRYSTSGASFPRMVGPCRCHSAHPKAERMQTCSLLGFLCLSFFIFSLSILFSLKIINSDKVLCYIFAIRSEGVFLHRGRPAHCRGVPQTSEVWPCPSCNWRLDSDSKHRHLEMSLLSQPVSVFSHSYLTRSHQHLSVSPLSCIYLTTTLRHLKSRCTDPDICCILNVIMYILFTSGLWLKAHFLWRSHSDQCLQFWKLREEYNPYHPVKEREHSFE